MNALDECGPGRQREDAVQAPILRAVHYSWSHARLGSSTPREPSAICPINTCVVRSWSGYKRTMDGLSVSRLDCTPERASELSAIPSAHL
jgi:hypothetical protein